MALLAQCSPLLKLAAGPTGEPSSVTNAVSSAQTLSEPVLTPPGRKKFSVNMPIGFTVLLAGEKAPGPAPVFA